MKLFRSIFDIFEKQDTLLEHDLDRINNWTGKLLLRFHSKNNCEQMRVRLRNMPESMN